MYYDDQFDPSKENEYSNDNRNKGNKIMDEFKAMDKNYFSFKKYVSDKKGSVKIELYGSYDIGSTIRNAITGVRYKDMIVGSSAEDQFFKVKMFNGNKGVTLFYDSPEDYERHQYQLLDERIKQKWHEKQR
jgi:hypothetical protein